jgi:hypothetical protein
VRAAVDDPTGRASRQWTTIDWPNQSRAYGSIASATSLKGEQRGRWPASRATIEMLPVPRQSAKPTARLQRSQQPRRAYASRCGPPGARHRCFNRSASSNDILLERHRRGAQVAGLMLARVAGVRAGAGRQLRPVAAVLGTTVKPNVLVVYDNSQSMDGTMAGKVIAGDDATTRGNIARTVLRNTITSYRNSFQWGLASFGLANRGVYTTYGYFFGSDAEVVYTNDCVAGISATNGNRRCVANPQPGNGFSYLTYGQTGDDPVINDVLYWETSDRRGMASASMAAPTTTSTTRAAPGAPPPGTPATSAVDSAPGDSRPPTLATCPRPLPAGACSGCGAPGATTVTSQAVA